MKYVIGDVIRNGERNRKKKCGGKGDGIMKDKVSVWISEPMYLSVWNSEKKLFCKGHYVLYFVCIFFFKVLLHSLWLIGTLLWKVITFYGKVCQNPTGRLFELFWFISRVRWLLQTNWGYFWIFLGCLLKDLALLFFIAYLPNDLFFGGVNCIHFLWGLAKFHPIPLLFFTLK